MPEDVYDYTPGLDKRICEFIDELAHAGIQADEPTECGKCGRCDCHLYPVVRFQGEQDAGFLALAMAMRRDLSIKHLSRTWPVISDEPRGPYWELTFHFHRKCDE